MDRSSDNRPDHLPQLLTYAASACPSLHSLSLTCAKSESGDKFSAYMLSLGLLSQLRYLHLKYWSFPASLEGLEDIRQLSGLSALKVSTDVHICIQDTALRAAVRYCQGGIG